ncbi:MAG: tetratricopeptide repeat protein, partial [Anaerolineae bacterium]
YNDPVAYRRAERDFTRALEILPTFVQALYDRGLLRWRELADGKGAEEDLTRVLELDPKRTEAWFNRALAREVTGDLAGAVADFRRYLSEGADPQWREISRRQIAVIETGSTQEEE